MTTQLSILIPALNESGNIKKLIENIKRRLHSITGLYEIVVVDGGSTDGTQVLAKDAGAKIFQQKGRGYGTALRESFPLLQGEYIITMDADFSHDPFFIQEMWNKRGNASVIVASRYVACGSSDATFFRRLLSSILNKVFYLVLSIPIHDFSSGFRMYKKKALDSITIESKDYEILEEILIKLFCEGYRIQEIPFHYAARSYGRSKARVFKLGIAYMVTLFRMWKLRNSIQSADYDSRAYESRLFPQRYWQRKRYHIIQDMIRDVQGCIVDIGCGSSRIVQNISTLIGIDIKMNKLRFVQKANPRLMQASAFALPIRGSSCDGVVCSQVIEHIPFDKNVIPELSRILKKGETLVLGTPDYGTKTWRIIEFFYKLILPNAYADEHIAHYTRASLQSLLKKHGFDVIEYRYIVGSELIIKAKKN